MSIQRNLSTRLILTCALTLAYSARPAALLYTAERNHNNSNEVMLTAEAAKKLEDWEKRQLRKADEAFEKKNWAEAGAAYDNFIVECPKSKALGYAIVRQGRCLHMDNKRLEAVRLYQDVLDFFPNDVAVAAPAVYFKGLAYKDNGDIDLAMKAWGAMAQDESYRKHPLAAYAINELSDFLISRDKAEDAVPYLWQVAVDFRASNPRAAQQSISRVVEHYVRRATNEAKLREFFALTKGFDDRPQKIDQDLAVSRQYWHAIMDAVQRYGRFDEHEADKKVAYYRTWAAALEGKFADWDDFQLAKAKFYRLANGDDQTYLKRLADQYAAYQKDGDQTRTIRWLELVITWKNQAQDYYGKLDFDKMTYDQKRRVLAIVCEGQKDQDLVDQVFAKINLAEVDDRNKANLAEWLFKYDKSKAELVIQSIADRERSLFVLLELQGREKNVDLEKMKELVTALAGSEKYNGDAQWIYGESLNRAKKWDEALTAYRNANKGIEGGFAIAECLFNLNKLELAVEELRGVENIFKDQASRASMAVAQYYKKAAKKELYVAELRKIVKVYKNTPQGSSAHQQLEELGLATGGNFGDN